MDMRKRLRERAALAQTYADDGAYHSAARVLRELAAEIQDHADRTGVYRLSERAEPAD